jgi:uncharacterized protein YjbJ (UPF0337 family)
MNTMEKIKHAAESARGRAKVARGRATGNRTLTAKGKGIQIKSDLKHTVAKVKDAAKH